MRIWELYDGFKNAHGTYEVQGVDGRGKRTGRALTVRSPVTEAVWQEHLDGKRGIGIVPLREDNTLCWAAIDIDEYQGLDFNALETSINELGLPLVIIKSKSGGAHLTLYLDHPCPADDIVDVLAKWAAALGYGGSEIFPKQTTRLDDNDIGNWLNAPYFDKDRAVRVAIRDGKPLSYEDFLEYAESKMVTWEQIQAIEIAPRRKKDEVPNDGPFLDGPPCLQWLHANGGLPEGTRNEGMFSVGVFLMRAFPDTWEQEFTRYNSMMCDPPMPPKELDTIVKSLKRKEYQYGCKKHPLKERCNKRLCVQRLYGVGPTAETGRWPEIENLTMYEGEPAVWVATIAGKRIALASEHFINQTMYRRELIDKLGVFAPSLPRPRFEKYMSEKIPHADRVVATEDTTGTGVFLENLSDFLTGKLQAKTPIDLYNRGLPYRAADGMIYFKFNNLLEHLSGLKTSRGLSNSEVSVKLKEVGAENIYKAFDGVPRVRLWMVPADKIRAFITEENKGQPKDDKPTF